MPRSLLRGCLFLIGCLVAAKLLAAEAPPSAPVASAPAGSDRARAVLSNFPSRGQRSDPSIPPRTPQQAVDSFKLMEGLEAEVVLSEPIITQPLFLHFDERGRLWVVQYIQYPYPAGLKIVDLGDQFHATYDKVPPPPPRNDRGADRISIHEDADGDGTFETHKVFLEGLNMVTAIERGRGGVWVLNPPYLLFYPDADDDDIPDGDPIVHLAGFGLEDTHSIANSLQWGPDGWLWGAHGSGVTANIKRPGLDDSSAGFRFKGQAIWRYHPERRLFELFAEGGGNTFSLFIDSKGRVFSGTNGGGTRGLHYVQGGFYNKNFGEHGYLTNPHAFGYFSAMRHNWDSPRFSQTLAFYEDGLLGDKIEGRFIAPNALRNRVDLSERIADGSTYRTEDVAPLLETDDRWFRPVDTKIGPDGAVYLADWYDTRLTHMDPRDTWDRQHGRVYRIKASGAPPSKAADLSAKSSADLVKLLSHRQSWFRRTALRLLADRKDRSVLKKLDELARDPKNPHALDALWALHAVSAVSAPQTDTFLHHGQAEVRMWALRLWGDRPQPVPSTLRESFIALAKIEPDPQVRSQLACTARRLPAEVALPVTFALMHRVEDTNDPHLPLLLWWALERFAETDRSQIVDAFAKPEIWAQPIVQKHIVSRLARRYASLPSPENQQALAALAKAAPTPSDRALVRQGLAEAFEGQGIGKLTPALENALFNTDASAKADPVQLSLDLKRGETGALPAALVFIVREEPALEQDRVRIIEALSESRMKEAMPVLLELLARSPNTHVREAAVSALGRFDEPRLAAEILRIWSTLDVALRRRALAVLASRPSWIREMFASVGRSGVISKADIPDDIVDRARLFGDTEINQLADHYFGQSKHSSSADKQRRIDELGQVLKTGPLGQAEQGHAIFQARCGLCHKLFGEGAEIGPDLTAYERSNVTALLLAMIDPSVAIREGYAAIQITTKDGRVLLGFVQDRDANRIALRESTGQRTVIALSEVQEERVMKTSLMPEGLLDDLSDDQWRDLFAYLTAK